MLALVVVVFVATGMVLHSCVTHTTFIERLPSPTAPPATPGV